VSPPLGLSGWCESRAALSRFLRLKKTALSLDLSRHLLASHSALPLALHLHLLSRSRHSYGAIAGSHRCQHRLRGVQRGQANDLLLSGHVFGRHDSSAHGSTGIVRRTNTKSARTDMLSLPGDDADWCSLGPSRTRTLCRHSFGATHVLRYRAAVESRVGGPRQGRSRRRPMASRPFASWAIRVTLPGRSPPPQLLVAGGAKRTCAPPVGRRACSRRPAGQAGMRGAVGGLCGVWLSSAHRRWQACR
jgi:hypothetical protein